MTDGDRLAPTGSGTERIEHAPSQIVKIADLHPFPGNPRVHDLPRLMGSLRRHGMRKPIVINTGTLTGRPDEIIAGHGIVEAATQLGWEHVSVVRIDATDADAAAYLAEDNEASDRATNDPALLLEVLQGLPDVSMAGWTVEELDDLRIEVEDARLALIAAADDVEEDEPAGGKEIPGGGFQPNSDTWGASGRRMMILDMSVPLFVWVQDQMAVLRDKLALDSNLAVVLHLVQQAVGEAPPDDPDATDRVQLQEGGGDG